MRYDGHPKMPTTESFVRFDGKDYPVWYLRWRGMACQVSTVELQDRLFVGGDTGNDYVSGDARLLAEQIAYYVSREDTPDTVRAAVFGTRPQDAGVPPGVPVWRAAGNCVYNGDDAGSLVAECASRAVAEALVRYANGSFALRRRVAEALAERGGR